ncbi:MAG: hypothetical protein HC866_25545 [Leptolyngbyaceae cyanobacterium RU_5_1]|nr:hypothetical protein [Leptolyngbyaceae cyanobacterium RU_5_1]
MTQAPQDDPTPTVQSASPPVNVDNLFKQLRRKEGTWVEWGQACQILQKAGYTPQVIFEESGFEPIHQNQVIVGAQVYASILAAGVSEATKTHFEHKGSDVLYELRVLSQAERAAVAELALTKNLDLDEAREAAKAVKGFAWLSSVPEGFTNHPGDAIAYQVWKLARQKSDLQERSRLIAKGLRFAHSDSARQKIEQLLTDFTVVPATLAPSLPVYRLEEAEDLPRILPVVGKFPLTRADLQAVPLVEEIEPFSMVTFSGTAAWVPVPGWQVVQLAEDAIAILGNSNALPTPLAGKVEDVLIVVDRAQRQWDASSYFLIEQADQLQLQWFAEPPEIPLLGRVILVVRPKKVLDENYTRDPWQIDE